MALIYVVEDDKNAPGIFIRKWIPDSRIWFFWM